KEHVGFLDGSSQPDPLHQPADPRFATPLGDFLLGYPDSHGDQVDCPPIFADGSFLVVRKLRQNVKDFEAFLDRTSQECGISKDELRGYLIGRDMRGVPLGLKKPGNDFDYDSDPEGHRCPLQAHARRANPRLRLTPSAHAKPMVTPRILRRGFPYGPERRTDGGDDQGLLFLAYNARIAEQFEVLQRWINGANITGLSSDQNDVLVGCPDPQKPRRFTFKHGPVVKSVELPRGLAFVTLEWGVYLFTPSLPALSELAHGRVIPGLIQARRADGDAKVGEELIKRLRAIENGCSSREDEDDAKAKDDARERARLAWKKILEDQDEDTERRAASIWAAIRKHSGVLKTPYGILVGGAAPARAVLNDESLFSVREYWARMTESFGPLYLGMDRKVLPEVVCPSGRDAAYVAANAAGKICYDYNAAINAELSGIKREGAFEETLSLTRAALARARRKASNQDQATIDLTLLAEEIVGQLSTSWFGFPDPAATGSPSPSLLIQGEPESLEDSKAAYCPYDFTVASQHIFRPSPDRWAIRASQIRGKVAQHATQAFLTAAQGAPKRTFLKSLFERFPNDMEAVRQGLIGAVDGFVAATYGSFVSVVDRWIEEGTLTTMQRQYGPLLREDPSRLVDGPSRFVDEIHATMKRRPVPPTIYRTALAATSLGDVQVQRGDLVVVYLGSAAHLQRDDELLFGGKYQTIKGAHDPVHACPGRELAIGVLCGLFAAIFERANLRREDRLILSFHP
ncbi:MAG TPA: hypothetical protein VG963_32315, partial [Polyangiaceae bacterium]|nr:hypothetical protein [Polyangiaceae bacterium]